MTTKPKPKMTLREIHDETVAFATTTIQEAGKVVPMFVGVTPDGGRGLLLVQMPDRPELRDVLAMAVGDVLAERHCHAYSFMSEVWLSRMAEAAGRVAAEQHGIEAARQLPPPSSYPDARDGLAIISCDDQGNSIAAVLEVKKDDDGKVSLEPWHPPAEHKAGDATSHMDGRFHDLLRKAAATPTPTLASNETLH